MNDLASPPTLEATIRAQELGTVRLPPVRSFLAESADLRAALRDTEPWLTSAAETLAVSLPLPRTVTSFVAQPFYRPPTSHRSFYYWPSALAGGGRGAGRAVLAFKGLEPCAPDVDALFGYLRRPCFSPHNMAEHLAIEEHKIPACLGLGEAVREAERAAAMQAAHFRAYGTLARLPFPLWVFRHSDETAARVLADLRQHLSAAALEVVEPLVSAGLGVYVYYYPTPPARARDVDFALRSFAFAERLIVLRAMCDPDELIRRWVSGLVRMLYLGVLPASLSSLRTGTCCQPQNACLDGGFVDLESLTPIGELRDDTAVAAALQFTMDSMLRTVRSLVAGSSDPTRKEGSDVRVDLHYLTQHLLARFAAAIETEARPGLELDPRVRRYFTPAPSFADLAERLGTYYSPSSQAFDTSNQDFGEFGLSVLTAARDL